MEKKNQITISKKGLITFVVIALIIIGANAYATSKGYSNIFFMINHTNKEEVVTDKDEILSEQVEEILKEKFEIAVDFWLTPEKYFNTTNDTLNGESIKRITNFDEVIAKYGTNNFAKEIKNNLPALLKMENGKVYVYQGGGFQEYDGVESFENTVVTDNKITTVAKIKENALNDNGDVVFSGYEYVKFSVVKQGNDWLIDEIDSKVIQPVFNENTSENEALLKEKFEVGTDLYFLDENYFSISSDSNNIVQTDEYGSLHLITNYDEVVNKFFTDRIKKDFEKKAVCLVVYNNKHYLAEGGPGFVQFDKVESFDNTVVTDNKITTTCKIREKDPDDNFLGYEYAKFSLVKQGNDWLIDEMEYWLGDRNEMKEEDISNNNKNTTESLVKEKFEIAVDFWLTPEKYFNTTNDTLNGESVKRITNFDEVISKYGTENFAKEIKNNLPALLKMENGKVYVYQGGGFQEYDGVESFENTVVTDNKITTVAKIKENALNDNSDVVFSGYEYVKFSVVKQGNDWLIDEIDSSIININ